jgi:hypothetical protein
MPTRSIQEGTAVAETIGFGRSEEQLYGARRFAVEPVADLAATEISVNGSGVTGSCEGDSGAPLLGVGTDGRYGIIGVLEGGSSTCVDRDTYVRADIVAAWAVDVTGDPASVGGNVFEIAPAGMCVRNFSVRRESGALSSQDCGSGDCGWSGIAGGFACLAGERDACEGIGRGGTCKGSILRQCTNGRVDELDCAACGSPCGVSGSTGSAECLVTTPQ